jgi:hypothetical protein
LIQGWGAWGRGLSCFLASSTWTQQRNPLTLPLAPCCPPSQCPQGTNAHLLLAELRGAAGPQRAPTPCALAARRRPLLRPARLYVVPHVHPFLSALLPAGAGGGGAAATVTLVCRLGGPPRRLAHLWEHVVAGRPLLPAAAMLEAFAATAAAATADDALDGAAPAAAASARLLRRVAITAPLVLPRLRGGAPSGGALEGSGVEDEDEDDDGKGELLLTVRLDLATGELILASGAGFEPPRQHATASLARLAASPAVAPAAPPPAEDPAVAARAAALLETWGVRAPRAACPQHLAARQSRRPEAVGAVDDVSADWRASGYFTNPRQVDAALHLGVAAPGSGAKVPVALEAFAWAAPDAHAASAQLPAACLLRGGASGNAAADGGASGVASFWLGAPGAGAAVALEGLETRVMAGAGRRGAAAAQEATGAGAQQASYEVEWVVDGAAEVGAPMPAPSSSPAAVRLEVALVRGNGGSSAAFGARLDAGCGPAAAAAAAVAMLQRAQAPAGGRAALTTTLAVDGAAASLPTPWGAGLPPAQAGVWGLLRTAATERPDAAVRVVLGTREASATVRFAAANDAPAGDGQSHAVAALAGGAAAAVPRLLAAAPAEGVEWLQVRPEPRSSLANLIARAVSLEQVRRLSWGLGGGSAVLLLLWPGLRLTGSWL